MCFFFQAEDGIRDGHVTGVQTCALPILTRVSDRDNTVLRHLGELGLRPDSLVEVRSRQLELGIITVVLDGRSIALGTPVAEIGRASCRARAWGSVRAVACDRGMRASQQ